MFSFRPPKQYPRPNPYKGFLQEARTYLSYFFHHPNRPSTKFVILSQARSGSTLLVSLLDSHPEIQCEGELIYYRKLLPIQYIQLRSRMSDQRAFGFKVIPSHIQYQGYADARKFIAQIQQAGFQIIKLSRRDLAHAAISLLYAQKRGKYHNKKSEKAIGLPKVTMDPNELLAIYDWLRNLADLQDEITSRVSHLALTYEDHLLNPSDQQKTVDRICDYLNLPHAQVTTSLAKISSKDYTEYISNIDEIQSVLYQATADKKLLEIHENIRT